MGIREDIVELASTQVKVAKFVHQGRLWDKELDCIGLIVLTHIKLGFPAHDYTCYGRNPNPRQLIREILKVCDPVSPGNEKWGDILLCSTAFQTKVPHHAGIFAPPLGGSTCPTMIHTHAESTFVQRVPYSEPWIELTKGFYRWRR